MRKNKLMESERALTMQQARELAANNNGFSFEANDPASLQRGIQLMQQQLRDMEENPNRYIQALERGCCIAGFGGDLFGVEVPETLMYGEVPPGTTPLQAFQQVVDYMKKVIAIAQQKGLAAPTTSKPKASVDGARVGRFRLSAPSKVLESIDRLVISTASWGI